MGFWIFLFIMNVLLPIIMIGFGSYFANHAPVKINPFIGYRTAMSMKNEETWKFAHHHCGRVWRVTGGILLIATVAVMLLVLGESEDTMGAFGLIVVGIQLVVLICSIIPTEKALKKKFDKDGNRRI